MKDLILTALREAAKCTKEPHSSKEISEVDAYFLIVDFLNTLREDTEENIEITPYFIRDLISAGQEIIDQQEYENNFK
mgnify:CR=1 FL=1